MALVSKERELWESCSSGDLYKVERLLSFPGINVNYQDDELGRTPLFRACGFLGNVGVVDRLLKEKEIDPNLPSREKITPLHIACQQGHTEVVSRLLQDPRLNPTPLSPPENISPFYLACQEGRVPILLLLLSTPSLVSSHGGWFFNTPLENGTTPFYIACEFNREEAVGVLLDAPVVDVNRPRGGNATPLFIACQEGHLKIVKMLLSSGRMRNINAQSETGTTPLWIASQNNHVAIVKWLLLSKEIDVFRATFPGEQAWCGRRASQQARKSGNHVIAEMLEEVEKGKGDELRQRLKKELGLDAREAAEIFAMIVFYSDNFLQISSKQKEKEEEKEKEKVRRFFEISSQLPIELQMLLANRMHNRPHDIIRSHHIQKAFGKIARAFSDGPISQFSLTF